MEIEMNSIIEPKPNLDTLSKEESIWHVELPSTYREFIMEYNGAIPVNRSFVCRNHEYAIDRFLCILNETEKSKYSSYDIDVVLTQIEERLTDNEDLIGCELLPIAQLFTGDYLCLNFKENAVEPTVYVWNHEESGELEPVIYKVSNSFMEFISNLF